jgi:hypothetical protein
MALLIVSQEEWRPELQLPLLEVDRQQQEDMLVAQQ